MINPNPSPVQIEDRNRHRAAVEANRDRRERLGDNTPPEPLPPTFCDKVTSRNFLDRDRVAELLPFLTAFATGNKVWQWSPAHIHHEGCWVPLEQFDMLLRVEALSLCWRDDAPELKPVRIPQPIRPAP
jgi:hypothetical protein